MNSLKNLACAIMLGLQPSNLRGYLRAMLDEYRNRNRRKRALLMVNPLLASHRPLRLELGSGGFGRDGWIGIDLCSDADLQWDLREPLPFPDGSIMEIHSEHVFEHLDFPDELLPLLGECWRVLRTNGIISFSVPNMRPLLEAYVEGNRAFLEERIWDLPPRRRRDYVTDLDLITWFASREGDHRCMFDPETAIQRLRDVGFVDIHVREFDPERDYPRRLSSVYVQAVKPLVTGRTKG